MRNPLLTRCTGFALLALSGISAHAGDFGTVISSTPVVASVPVPQRQCTEEQWVYPPRSSGVGAALGAIAGAAVGSQFGSGSGRAAATALGLVAGSAIGERAETEGAPAPTRVVERCRSVTRLEPRTIGYDVVYEYQGVQRTARLAQEPGERIALDIVPAGQLPPTRWSGQAATPRAAPDFDDDADRPPPRVVYVQPSYRAAPVYAYGWPYPAVGVGVVIGNHHGHHRGWHHRQHRHGWHGR